MKRNYYISGEWLSWELTENCFLSNIYQTMPAGLEVGEFQLENISTIQLFKSDAFPVFVCFFLFD